MKNFYYALTLYHVLCCILHKLKFNSAISEIAISDLTMGYKEIAKKLLNTKLFNKIYIIPDSQILVTYHNGRSSEESLAIQNTRLEKILKEIDISLQNYSDLYICADHFPLGTYCVFQNIKYNYFEDGCGQYSRSSETIDKMVDCFQKETAIKYGLFGLNSNVQKRLIDIQSQIKDYIPTNKDINFSVKGIIKKLTKSQKNLLKDVFDFNIQTKSNSNSVLFLPQHNVNLRTFTIEEQLYQTSLLLDFFCQNSKIYIKPHPNDYFTNYTKLGSVVNIIPSMFPAELLLLWPYKFKKGITAWSTSIHSLDEILNEKIYFTSEIDQYYKDLYRYYAIVLLLNRISKNRIKIFTKFVYVPLLENLLKFCDECKISYSLEEINDDFSNITMDNNVVFIIDDKIDINGDIDVINWIEKLFTKVHKFPILFINSNNFNLFFNGNNYSIYKNMGMWNIHKQLLFEPDLYSDIDIQDERIWFYMEDENMKEKINDISIVKELKCSKIVTYINTIDDNFKIPDKNEIYRSIKTLEGILEATQSRLDFEIKEHKND